MNVGGKKADEKRISRKYCKIINTAEQGRKTELI